MSKISQDKARQIALRATEHAFKARREACASEEHVLFDRAFAQVWDRYPDVDAFTRLEQGLFPRISEFAIRSTTGAVRIAGEFSAPMPYNVSKGWNRPEISVGEALAADVTDFAFRRKSVEEEADKTCIQTKLAILGIGTWNRLKIEWPEIWVHASILAPTIRESTNALVNVEALNKALGLPISETQGEQA